MARAEYRGHHLQLRAALIAAYQPGVTPCFLCGKPMADPPRLLDLAHRYPRSDPRRHTGPRGLAHQRCNRGPDVAKARAANRNANADPAGRSATRW